MKVLHLSPHPDDELLGCPAVLFALQNRGHEITNLACSLGKQDQNRRLAELREAHALSGWQLLLAERSGDVEADTTRALQEIIADYHIIVSPSLWDAHPAHEAVALAARKSLLAGQVWWQWSLWGNLPRQTLLYNFSDESLERVEQCLAVYAEELRRNDYAKLLRARAEATAVLGPEQCFGFGSAGSGEKYAEVLLEVLREEGGWRMGPRRTLLPEDPLPVSSEADASSLLELPSASTIAT